MKKSIYITLAIVAFIGLITPVIGPFTFYAAVVPTLGPILPRPVDVPKYASASYNWKGAGMGWSWKRSLPHGCADLQSTESYMIVYLTTGRDDCKLTGEVLSKASFDDHIVFGRGRSWIGGQPCPYAVPRSNIAAYQRLVGEARFAAETEGEKAILRQVSQRLASVDGSVLTTDHTGGCNDLKLSDYGHPRSEMH